MQRRRRFLTASLFVLVASAAWLMPRHPIVAACLLALVLALPLFRWVTSRAMRQVNEAGLRCDLNALEALARKGSILIRGQAMFAFIHHGGFERAPAGALFCSCGGCAKDQLGAELDALRRMVVLAWSGHAPVLGIASLARGLGDGALSGPLNEVIIEWRLITQLMGHALSSRAGDREAIPYPDLTLEKLVEPRWPSLRWPARLAMAIEAASCGQPEVARRHVAGMPAWPEGSRLEEARRELLASLAGHDAKPSS